MPPKGCSDTPLRRRLGKSINLIVPTDHRDEVRGILDRIGNGELIDRYETVRVNNEGRRIDVSLSVSPVKSTSGTIIGAAKVARDITATKRAQIAFDEEVEERRKLLEILSNTISSMVDAVLVADVGGRGPSLTLAAGGRSGFGTAPPPPGPAAAGGLRGGGVGLFPFHPNCCGGGGGAGGSGTATSRSSANAKRKQIPPPSPRNRGRDGAKRTGGAGGGRGFFETLETERQLAAVAEDGGGRPADRRHRPRLQQHPHRHHRHDRNPGGRRRRRSAAGRDRQDDRRGGRSAAPS